MSIPPPLWWVVCPGLFIRATVPRNLIYILYACIIYILLRHMHRGFGTAPLPSFAKVAPLAPLKFSE